MFKNKTKTTVGTLILTAIFIIIEHYEGGVVSHHLFAREDLPGISNWWGLFTVPILTWIVCSIINRRGSKELERSQIQDEYDEVTLTRFLSALVFGVLLSILWEYDFENILQYIILLPFLVAIFKPVHFPEHLLGFVIGMLYTFGGVLPILIGLVLLTVSFIINKLIQILKSLTKSKKEQKKEK